MLYLLRPDECAAIAWCMTGVLWSDALAKLPPEKEQSNAKRNTEYTTRKGSPVA